ncbi:hypothetical protein [Mechercharimyces sp. CAU 1602]|uniref:hypothetical protein n=1 Tax=Mechercharimyces sp. CAU 1602 TaxID=2973933 RepID=UPI002161286E|nr:hypothetical protein [Mechercharimyces sp. CAU 1602]MCS1352646.1 hypothetical protein [Mechercharimyces sp. CAU 1602]
MEEHHDHFARHGGVHFTANVSADQINQFVNDLPSEKRNSLYEVMKHLDEAGLISLYNDGLLADGDGEVGGSQEC